MSVIDESDSALAELLAYALPVGELARTNRVFLAEVRHLCARLLSRLELMREEVRGSASGHKQWQITSRWRHTTSPLRLALTRHGEVLIQEGPRWQWMLLQEAASESEVQEIMAGYPGTWQRQRDRFGECI